MIARFQQQTDERPRPAALRQAHRLVAKTFLKSELSEPTRRVPVWQAWLFTAWAVTATVAWFAYMAGLL